MTFEKTLLYLKENAIEKTLMYCQNEVTLILKNPSVLTRKTLEKYFCT